jgi:hypothetical protein
MTARGHQPVQGSRKHSAQKTAFNNAEYAEKNERRQRVMAKVRITLKVNATFPSAPSAIFATSALTERVTEGFSNESFKPL